ncbi:unnamed protein product [Brassicogethes aeneus]|uniref:Uncharacterized protein n=1 Tax=Brassicogethes aeneus TaxID=1431903 RepID=A0A9P0FGK7_BRAAE|nr:unnamed protein product [Brassicogethes aeneus]
MVPTKVEKTKKSWSELNKTKKEEKKKWKENNMLKKMDKQKLVETLEAETEEAAKVEEIIKKEEIKPVSTLSIAVAGSILENAQSPELRTYLAGQIARAACIFQVDEIVVFDDFSDEANAKKSTLQDNQGIKTARICCTQLGRILQYLECPQYLRKCFFPIHKDLKFSGILNPLNAPHHLSVHDEFMFREGVVTNKPVKAGKGSLVNVGLYKDCQVDKLLTTGIRCTVKLLPQETEAKKLQGVVVSPDTPRNETGTYWGYSVRIANSLSQVFSQCTYKNGYDLTIGTSDKGTSVDDFECPSYEHALIMFGGLQGLEAALENDISLNAEDPKLLFDVYLNTLPEQGSKTIRTEEAILVSLAGLRPKLNPQVGPKSFFE